MLVGSDNMFKQKTQSELLDDEVMSIERARFLSAIKSIFDRLHGDCMEQYQQQVRLTEALNKMFAKLDEEDDKQSRTESLGALFG